MGRPATAAAEQAASQNGGSPRGVVVAAVRQAADSVRQADEMDRQPARGGMALPAIDPLGLVEAATGSLFRDPIAASLRPPASRGRSPRGGPSGR